VPQSAGFFEHIVGTVDMDLGEHGPHARSPSRGRSARRDEILRTAGGSTQGKLESAEVTTTDDDYDVAVSFAGEHREYVEAVVDAAKALGLRVFYDRDMTNELWGKNFLTAFRKVYSSQTRYFVPFISVEYFSKSYPRDEFS
jgi:hypothetical protein